MSDLAIQERAREVEQRDKAVSEMHESAPKSMETLKYLMIISSKSDFKLTGVVDSGEDSFNGRVVLVGDGAHEALSKGHTSMVLIDEKSLNVPKQLDDSIVLLTKGLVAELTKLLDVVQGATTICVDQATNTAVRFVVVKQQLSDLIESCTNSSALKKNESDEIKSRIKSTDKVLETEKELQAMTEEHIRDMTECYTTVVQLYKPGQEKDEGLSNKLTSIFKKAADSAAKNNPMKIMIASMPSKDTIALPLLTVRNRGALLDNISTLLDFLSSKQDLSKNAAKIRDCETELVTLRGLNKEVLLDSHFKAVIDIASQLSTTQLSPDDIEFENVAKTLRDIRDKVASMSLTDTAIQTAGDATKNAAKGAVAAGQGTANISENLGKEAAEDMVATVKEQLDDTENFGKELKDRASTLDRDLVDLRNKCDTLQGVLDLLLDGLDAITQLNTQWAALVQFFKFVKTTIETTLDVAVQDFSRAAENKAVIDGMTELAALTGVISVFMNRAKTCAEDVHVLAHAYVETVNTSMFGDLNALGPQIEASKGKLKQGSNTLLQLFEKSEAVVQKAIENKQVTIGTLEVTLLSASNLKVGDMDGKSDPWVRLVAGKKTQDSPTVRKSLNPVWNFKFPNKIQVDPQNPELSAFRLVVWDQDLATSDYLGEATIVLTKSQITHNNKITLTQALKAGDDGKKEKGIKGDITITILVQLE